MGKFVVQVGNVLMPVDPEHRAKFFESCRACGVNPAKLPSDANAAARCTTRVGAALAKRVRAK